ncbi:DUF4231 domain-containing protein [Streptomyces sp. NPDC002209]|uniref:DUF4231 domain-containing protein n=1 Tax=Streptomyces sp. NPDC002209 TaxID=3364638 RepID=UPI003698C37B
MATVDPAVLLYQNVEELRRKVKAQRIRRVRLHVSWIGVVVLALLVAVPTAVTWERYDMAPYNVPLLMAMAVMAITFFATANDMGAKSVDELRMDLELAEEQRVLHAVENVRPAHSRQFAYKELLPQEIARLGAESRRYRRWHNTLQMGLIVCSAGITAASAVYDPPQPGKGIIILLGASVTVITAVSGFFKFRERGFNLQQTADEIEQHLTALNLSIAPYNQVSEEDNLRQFTAAVEGLRTEQRKREQQLDQPHQQQGNAV